MKNFFKTVWQDEPGQGATEYILILVVVSVIVLTFKDKIKGIIETRTEAIGGKLDGVFNSN